VFFDTDGAQRVEIPAVPGEMRVSVPKAGHRFSAPLDFPKALPFSSRFQQQQSVHLNAEK
jgi:hypothetical protein